jgi:hypothetical protein
MKGKERISEWGKEKKELVSGELNMVAQKDLLTFYACRWS